MNRSLVAVAAVCGALVSAPSYATVNSWPTTPPVLSPIGGQGQVTAFGSSSEQPPSVDTIYTFSVDSTPAPAILQASLALGDVDSEYTPGSFSLWQGDYGSATLIETTTPAFVSGSWFAALSPVTVPNGDYYVQVIGQLTSPVSPVVSLTAQAIPEASTWAMMVAGFAGLGFAGFRTRRSAAAIA